MQATSLSLSPTVAGIGLPFFGPDRGLFFWDTAHHFRRHDCRVQRSWSSRPTKPRELCAGCPREKVKGVSPSLMSTSSHPRTTSPQHHPLPLVRQVQRLISSQTEVRVQLDWVGLGWVGLV